MTGLGAYDAPCDNPECEACDPLPPCLHSIHRDHCLACQHGKVALCASVLGDAMRLLRSLVDASKKVQGCYDPEECIADLHGTLVFEPCGDCDGCALIAATEASEAFLSGREAS